MNYDANDNLARDFKGALDHLLERAHLSLTDLAKAAEISRPNLQELKNGTWRPRTKTLIAICHVFQSKGLTLRQLTPLIFLALGLQSIVPQDREAFFLGQPYPFRYPPEMNLSTRTIFTDLLAECIYEDVLAETVQLMEAHGVEYFYFLPKGSPEWEQMLAKIDALYPQHSGLFRTRAFCIYAPYFLIYTRMRIDNIEADTRTVFLNLGTRRAPTLHRFDGSVIDHLIPILATVAAKARQARRTGEKTYRHMADGIGLIFDFQFS